MLFRSAKCVQCGGEVDLVHLRCENCNSKNIPIDWSRAIPVFTAVQDEKRYHDWRDRRLDAVIIAKLQILAAEAGVEIALELAGGGSTSNLKVLAFVPARNKWIEVGSICGYASHGVNDFDYVIKYANDPWGGFFYMDSVYLHWAADPGGGNGARWYTIVGRHRSTMSDPHKFRGEVGLYESKSLARVLLPLLAIALREEASTIEHRAKCAAEKAYAAEREAQPWYRRWLMREPDELYL